MLESVLVSCYRLLGGLSLCLKLCHGQVIMFLSIFTRWMLFSVIPALSREGKVSRHNFQLKCPILEKQKQISFGRCFRAGSHILPRSHPWWNQAPNTIGPVSSACPSVETSFKRLRPSKMAPARELQRQGWGRGSTLLKAWAKATEGP